MISRLPRFNIYFFGLLAFSMVLAGCKSTETKPKKVLAALRLHAEMNPDPSGKTEKIQVFRAEPFWLTINKEPFLNEAFIKEAKVIEVMGGFALQLQFDRKGSWLLEESTASLRGKHIAIFSQFHNPGEDKLNAGRWIAAPLVQARITDGLFTFTPDASRQEADLIATGLNNVAKQLETGKTDIK